MRANSFVMSSATRSRSSDLNERNIRGLGVLSRRVDPFHLPAEGEPCYRGSCIDFWSLTFRSSGPRLYKLSYDGQIMAVSSATLL